MWMDRCVLFADSLLETKYVKLKLVKEVRRWELTVN